jgi:hypothetical protein
MAIGFLREILIKVILIIISNIYLRLLYLEGHLSNYLVTSGKYSIYNILFTRGETI